ncbi:hypothetical protein FDT66_10550 [Polaribacter aestuariivivens]|uniref:STAS/SEC14 domain-containing protein n=1 Tax=Polaribacter aestuariivivens TaxID=2304626 RepID=A0A5S3N2S6_9FLAO|nr:hypothetical protein [Polaribacter aestuariivivens]TMM29550.1 hypothetical protein FDT66_10550 [Polaribacter aestuariivivens]
MDYKSTEKNLNRPNNISSKFFLSETKIPEEVDVLTVSFFGNYPQGSSGSDTAKYISKQIISGFINFDPDAIILDFRALTYNWGNSLLRIFQDISQFKDCGNTEEEPNFPVLILVSEKSKAGITSLLTPSNSEKPLEFIFEDENLALKEAFKKGKYWLDN